MIGDALLLTFDGADATAGALHTSTNIPPPGHTISGYRVPSTWTLCSRLTRSLPQQLVLN